MRNCSVVSSPSYLGVSCGSASGGGLTVKEILGKDPVPECWNERLTASELDAMGLANTSGQPGGASWYWERCLKGIDPKTYKIGPDGISFTIGLVSIKDGDPLTTLTERQRKLVEFKGADQQIPPPIAGVSPAAHPRVGGWVSFFDGSPAEVTASGGGAVVLRARVTSLEVAPLGEDDPARVSCSGTGVKAVKGDNPTTKPDGCWFKYTESSAAQPDQKYPVKMTANWAVEVSASGPNGPFTPFNTFSKSQITTVPVTEIQSIVVN
ncbi:hypothetical protein [Knoellia koreensis]|uniref:ATP/GTP-binding protein n=1 Tax=Knoellia koreensis TaxID=2730921 RepID=A0A849HI63_9MICO|nr:hypothetical protein [Knoellia sp. DB2414S]NNM44397.1 hypothetical protein [Knoellia sp. DB2414S]